MPFFFLYLYTNNNTMSEDLEKGLGRSKQLMSEIRSESGYLYDALTSIGVNIGTSIENAIEGMGEMDDIGKAIANTYKKDIVNSIKASARDMDKLVNIQIKLNKKQNASKQIQNQLDKLAAKKIVLGEKLNGIGKNKVDISAEEGVKLMENLTTAELILKKKLEENAANQSSISIFKLAGNALGGMVNKIDKSGTLSGILKGNFKEVVTVARMGQVASLDFVSSFIKGIGTINQQQVALQKNMGLSTSQAKAFRREMAEAAWATGSTAVNSNDTLKTLGDLNAQFGTASTLLGKNGIVGEMALLAKTTNLSAESQASFAAFSLKSGIHAKEVTRQARRAVVSAESERGVRVDINKVMDEAGKISGMIRANLGFNIIAIAKAVTKAKQFGLTLQDLAGISANLLDFQSSIENELTAELFIGRELNLEKARLYSLTGDYEGLTNEIVKNAGGELEFAKMNVLQKQKLAQALGMSANQMANMVYDSANLAELAEQARDMGDLELAKSLEKRDIQQQFNDLLVKAQTALVDMAAGPLGDLANGMANLLEGGSALYWVLGAIAVLKLGGLVSTIYSMATAFGLAGAAAGWMTGLATLGIGLAIAVPVIMATMASMNKSTQNAGKSMKRYNTLGATEMVSIEQGSAIFDENETVVRTENFSRLTDGIDTLIEITRANKPPKQLPGFAVAGKTR